MSRGLLKWCHVCLPVIYLALEIELIPQKTLSMDEWHITCTDLSPFVTTIVSAFTSYSFPQQRAGASEQKFDILKTRSVCCLPYLYTRQSKIYCSDVIWKVTQNTLISFPTSKACGFIHIYMHALFRQTQRGINLFMHNFPLWNAGQYGR